MTSASGALRRVYLPFAAAGIVVVVLDQLSKRWAETALSDGHSASFLGPVKFRLAHNAGMAFSVGTGSGAVIGAFAFVIVVVMAVVARKVRSPGAVILMGVVAGGALGNLADRLFRAPHTGFLRGHVVDFIYTSFWPTFNVADSAVVVGGVLLAVWVYRSGEAPPEPGADLEADSEVS